MDRPGYVKVPFDNLTKIDSYKLLTGCVVPRPIAWISTLSPDGLVNLAPYSAFTIVSKIPPKVLFSISKQKPGHTDYEYKDTEVNIRANGEFAVNIGSVKHAKEVEYSAYSFPPNVSEVDHLGLETVPSETISVPRLADVGVSFECKMTDMIDVSKDRLLLIIGQVTMFHIREDLYDNGKIDTMKLDPLVRIAGPNYASLGEKIHIPAYSEKAHRPYDFQ